VQDQRRDVPARHRARRHVLPEHAGEDVAADAPFLEHARGRQGAENVRMRMGMRADEVSAADQLAQAGGVEETAAADALGDHEEVAAPAPARELLGRVQGAAAAVVERDVEMAAGGAGIGGGHQLGRDRAGRDLLEVPREPALRERVRARGGTLKTRRGRIVRDLVVHQAGDDRR
jgi:hypothetical protein